NQLLDDRAQFLGLRQRGDDLLVLDQRGRHVGEHRLAMLGGAVELAMNLAVTHWSIPSSVCRDGSSDMLLRWAACVRPFWLSMILIRKTASHFSGTMLYAMAGQARP